MNSDDANTAKAGETDARPEYHRPVLLAEVLDAFAPVSGRLIVDGTLGGGGHTEALLKAGAKIIGLDRDGGAIGYCIQHLVVYHGDSVRLIKANYRDFGIVLNQLKIEKVDGLLLDLGISSAQIDRADRGFSFMRSGPLDMRMDSDCAVRAADLVNGMNQSELEKIFRLYGEEPAAGRVAAAIIRERRQSLFSDTLSLARTVETVIPKRGPRHPATRIFQALRIAVNDELAALKAGLESAVERLHPGGRLAVITFHSLEDRVMKTFARETTKPTIDRPEWSAPRPNPKHFFRSLSKRPIQASLAERLLNPRARSAKLRVLERVPLSSSPILR